MKTIEIIVYPDGKSRVETKGFSGGECRDASRFIEKAANCGRTADAGVLRVK